MNPVCPDIDSLVDDAHLSNAASHDHALGCDGCAETLTALRIRKERLIHRGHSGRGLDCDAVEALLCEMVDAQSQDLLARQTRSDFWVHLTSCPSCNELCERMTSAMSQLGDVPDPDFSRPSLEKEPRGAAATSAASGEHLGTQSNQRVSESTTSVSSMSSTHLPVAADPTHTPSFWSRLAPPRAHRAPWLLQLVVVAGAAAAVVHFAEDRSSVDIKNGLVEPSIAVAEPSSSASNRSAPSVGDAARKSRGGGDDSEARAKLAEERAQRSEQRIAAAEEKIQALSDDLKKKESSPGSYGQSASGHASASDALLLPPGGEPAPRAVPVPPAPPSPNSSPPSPFPGLIIPPFVVPPAPIPHPTAPTATGTISINCSPRCDRVVIDGVDFGASPIVNHSVSVGTRAVGLFRTGSPMKTFSVRVEPGQSSRLSVSMDAPPPLKPEIF